MDLIPGFIQGITRVTISYPFDTVKIYMQKNKYGNLYNTIKNIIRSDIKIFYRGSLLTYIIIPLDRSLQFYIAEKYKNKMNPYIISIALGFFTSLYNVPLLYITSNIVLEKKENYTNIQKFIKKVKIKELYKGIYIELPKTIVSTTSYMGTYYYLREKYNKNNDIYMAPIIGIISSICCWLIIFPIDTIRNDIQTSKNIPLNELIKSRYDKYGILNFYKGLTPVIIRTIPSSALGMLSYEITRTYIYQYKLSKN
jgi:hypothetical protein